MTGSIPRQPGTWTQGVRPLLMGAGADSLRGMLRVGHGVWGIGEESRQVGAAQGFVIMQGFWSGLGSGAWGLWSGVRGLGQGLGSGA